MLRQLPYQLLPNHLKLLISDSRNEMTNFGSDGTTFSLSPITAIDTLETSIEEFNVSVELAELD